MANFYVTYGYCSNLGRNFSVVEADDYAAARQKIHAAIGDDFAVCYDEYGFFGQIEKYGLTEVPLQRMVMIE